MRCSLLCDIEAFIHIRLPDIDIEIFKVEHGISIADDFVVCLNNFLYINIDEVIEAVDMLLHQALYFQKRRDQKPFILEKLS